MKKDMNALLDSLLNKPWILIIGGFFLLISVWVFFFIVASRNQPTLLLP